MLLVACILTASLFAVLAAPGAAAPPTAGLLLPGQSLGGIRLGATRDQVERAWGRAYGLCTGCSRETWYFNYFAFQPKGAGVELRAGRAAAIFTIYSPAGWHTPGGLALGATAEQVRTAFPGLVRRECSGYYALVRRSPGASTAFYLLDEKLWAFGLSRPEVPLCR